MAGGSRTPTIVPFTFRARTDELPTDLSLLSFKACSLLGLSAKREQAALQCRLAERVRVLRLLLTELEAKYAVAKELDEAEGTSEAGTAETGLEPVPGVAAGGSSSFVAAAVTRAMPSLVVVEPDGATAEGSEQKAAGFVVGSGGLVVTNRHVANSTQPATVTFEDGRRERATVLAESREYDVAFLRVKRSDAPAAALGDSDRCQLGDWLIALGHPAEFDSLATLGIASAIQRPAPTCPGVSPHALLDRSPTFIATDALYNKGISGGPLLNAAGEVVGMNTFLREDLKGLGFAIAIGRIRELALELLGEAI